MMQDSLSVALGFGFLLGLKHATEADHLMAVTTIVSEHRSVWRSALVGGLWGLGHTTALLLAGVLVILLRVAIPQRVATALEFAVAVMIILLGCRMLFRLIHTDRRQHAHPHEHGGEAATAVSRIGWRPLFIGLVHGLAGSAALTLLVLTGIMKGGAALPGIVYLLVFGLGSIGGMLLMSALISVPFVITAHRLSHIHQPVQWLAASGSIVFGIWYAWDVLHG